MEKTQAARRAAAALDRRFKEISHIANLQPPARGWIKAIRAGLGMSALQLARRLKVKQPTMTRLERSEELGTIQLATLRRVAGALDCRLVYALVPNKPLEAIAFERARAVARRRMAAVDHTMALEGQNVPDGTRQAQIDEFARTIKARELWNDV